MSGLEFLQYDWTLGELAEIVLLLALLTTLIVLSVRKHRVLSVPNNVFVLIGGCVVPIAIVMGDYLSGRHYLDASPTYVYGILGFATVITAVTFATAVPRERPNIGAGSVNRPCIDWHQNVAGAKFCSTCGSAVIAPSVGNSGQLASGDERDRPEVMFLWIWCFVFSPVVLFLSPRYASKARFFGFKEIARYWVPFWLTLSGYLLAGVLIAVTLT